MESPQSAMERDELTEKLAGLFGADAEFASDDLAPAVRVDRIEQFVRHELSELEAHEIASLLATFRPWFDAYRRVLGEISD